VAQKRGAALDIRNNDEMDDSRPKTIGEIIGLDQGDSPEAQVFRHWLDLLHSGAGRDEVLFKLPSCDRYLWLVYNFCSQVDNGGIDQFLFNSSGDYAAETLEALAAIGASRFHRALEQACALFPGGGPSKDHATREDQVRAINAKYGVHIDEIIAGECESNVAELLLDFRRRSR
jgi:hypothetical protein